MLFRSNVVGVPYKALGADLPDVIGGQVAIAFNFWAILEPLAKAGRLRVLAVASPNRLPPVSGSAGKSGLSAADAGFPELVMDGGCFGLFAPAGTPRPVLARLQSEAQSAMAQPQVRERVTSLGVDVLATGAAEFAAFFQQELKRYAERVQIGRAHV